MKILPNLTPKQARLLLWVSDLNAICDNVNQLHVIQLSGTFKVQIRCFNEVIKTVSIEDYKKVINN